MVTFVEGRHPLEGLMSEANFHRSRDRVTIALGSGVLQPGAVLGKITASGKYKLATATGTDGAQTAVAILGYGVDTTAADVDVLALTRSCEWNVNTLSFDASVNDAPTKAAKLAQLAAVGIIAR